MIISDDHYKWPNTWRIPFSVGYFVVHTDGLVVIASVAIYKWTYVLVLQPRLLVILFERFGALVGPSKLISLQRIQSGLHRV